MKKLLSIVSLLIFLWGEGFAQTSFVKQINTTSAVGSLKVFATNDQGWVIYAKENAHLTKFNLCGESVWSRVLDIPNATASLSDIISTQDNGFAILSREQMGDSHGTVITKLNSNGEISWSKSYFNSEYEYFPYTLSEDNNGNLIYYSNVTQLSNLQVFNQVGKINNSGNIIQSRLFNQGGIWGGAISTSDNGILFRTGSNFIKLNSTLDVQWECSILAATYHYLAPLEVSNGYLISANNQAGQIISYYKIDFQGNLLWGGRKNTNITGTPKALRVSNNGNVVGLYSIFDGGNSFATSVVFDEEMNVLSQKSLSQNNLNPLDICFLSNSNPVIAGVAAGSIYFARLYNDFSSDCNVDLNPVEMNLEAINWNNGTITPSDHLLNVADIQVGSTIENLSMVDLCSVEKILDLGADTVLCDGNSMTLGNKTDNVFDLYTWSTGETSPEITIYEPGNYWLVAEDFCDLNRANDTVFVEILPSVIVNLGEDLLLCNDSTEVLLSPDCTTCTFQWSNGTNGDTLLVANAGLYWLEAENDNGCLSKDSIRVDYGNCDCEVYFPNSFSPNGDGLNDEFKAKYYCDFEEYSLKIFNRWGELIFQTTNPEIGWDGTIDKDEVQDDTYALVLSYTPLILGKAGAVRQHIAKINLVR